MKKLLSHIWTAPASTFAGALIAALAFLQAADLDIPKPALIAIGTTAAFLGAFRGPK